MYTTLQRYFPDSEVSMVHQDGSETPAARGLEVLLFTREDESDPSFAELTSGEYGAEIGFSFEGRELIDFDGAFSLPREVAGLLRELGYEESEDLLV
jgi:hypothetical protein